MSNRTCSKVMVPFTAALVLAAGAAFGADLDPSGQAGQYETARPVTLVKGSGGAFAPSLVYVPFILLNDTTTGASSRQALLNSVVIENVGGRPIASVTTFGADNTSTVAPRVVAVLSTTDAASALTSGESNNVINNEGAFSRSSSHGAILPDGTLVTRENFNSTGQSNIGFWNMIQTLGVAEPTQAPNKVIVDTAVNIGNAAENLINPQTATIRGSAFLSTPSAVRDTNIANPVNGVAPDEDLVVGQTHFNGLPVVTAAQFPASFNGVAIYRGRNNSPVSGTPGPTNNGAPGADHEAGWTQDAVPLPTTPGGESRTDARQTSPILSLVRTPGGRDVVYQAHGIGFAGGSPFNGGSARALYLAVDTITNPDGSRRLNYVGSNPNFSFNTILIEGDAMGGVGTQHGRPYDAVAPVDAGYANHFVSDLNMKFVDHQATGGGNSFANSQFDMNSSGQIAALWVNEGVAPERYEVRVYNPIWDLVSDRIAGYNLSAVITFNGDLASGGGTIIVDEAITTIESSPGVFGEASITPISGVAIDDNGRVAFVGIREKFETTGDFDQDPITPDTRLINNTTNALFVWEPNTGTLHEVLRGGQNGDVLSDAFPADGPANNESVALGFFPVDEASDSFNRDGFSRTGGYLAVNFRSGGNERLNGANIELETVPCPFPPCPADTFDDNGGVLTRGSGATLNERAARGTVVLALGPFTVEATCCPGNASKTTGPGPDVNFADVTAVLANFGAMVNPNGTSAGDADCNGMVNFADITSVLANFGADCD